MGDREYRDELLDASYEAVKLELENTENDLEQLKQRAEKLRAAVSALTELLPERARVQTRGQEQTRRQDDAVPRFLREKGGSDASNGRDGSRHRDSSARSSKPVAEAVRASA